MKSQIAFAAALLASASLVACQILLGIENTDVAAPASSSSGAGASSSSGSVDNGPCPADPGASARPPSRPDGGASATDGGNQAPIVFAVRSILLAGEPGTPFGYDLDGVYTADKSQARCRTPSGVAAIDDEGGRDNAAVKVMLEGTGEFKLDPSILSESIQDDLDEGKGTTLYRLEEYNGEENDDEVAIRVASSPGLYREGADADADAGLSRPRWDGTDRWLLTGRPGASVEDPWYLQDTIYGYVSDYRLIIQRSRDRADDTPFEFPLFGKSIAFKQGVMSASLVGAGPSGYRFENGIVAGTALPVEVYQLLRDIPLLQIHRVCRLHTLGLGSVCARLLAGADIPAPGFCLGDVQASQACENISLTFGFTATQADVVLSTASDAGVVVPTTEPCAPFDFEAECSGPP